MSTALILVMFFLAIIRSLAAGEPGAILRAALVDVPAAIMTTVASVSVAWILIRIVDQASLAVTGDVGAAMGEFSASLATVDAFAGSGLLGITSIDELRARRTQMVAALAAAVLHRELSPTEDAALGWSIDTITHETTKYTLNPTLGDVVGLLVNSTGEMVTRAQAESARELARDVIELRHGLG